MEDDGFAKYDDDGSDFDEDLYLRAYLGQLGNEESTSNAHPSMQEAVAVLNQEELKSVPSVDQDGSRTNENTKEAIKKREESLQFKEDSLEPKEDEAEKSDTSDFAEEEFKKKFVGSRYFLEDMTIKCFNCGDYGHMASQCIQEKEIKSCFLCGSNEHSRSRCPQELCLNCQQPGHQSRVPPHVYQDNNNQECPKPRGGGSSFCMNCGLVGHSHQDCKQDPMGWRGRPPNIFCYNCGRKGHNGIQCQFPRMDDLMVTEMNKNSASPAASMFRLHLRQRRRSDPGDLRRWQDRFRENSDDSDEYQPSSKQRNYNSSPKYKSDRDHRDHRNNRNNGNRYSDEGLYRGDDNRNQDNRNNNDNRNYDIKSSGSRSHKDNRDNRNQDNTNNNYNRNRNDTQRNTPNNGRGRDSEKQNNAKFQVVHNHGTPTSSIVADQALVENTTKRWDDSDNDMQTNIQTHRRNDNREGTNHRKRSRSEPGGRNHENKKHRK